MKNTRLGWNKQNDKLSVALSTFKKNHQLTKRIL